MYCQTGVIGGIKRHGIGERVYDSEDEFEISEETYCDVDITAGN